MGIWRAFTGFFFKDSGSEEIKRAQTEQPRATILAIDDDQGFLEAMKALLTDAGFNVLTSSSGPKGLDTLQHTGHEIKVLLLDFHMPGFDGAETLQYVRKLNAGVKIVAMTGVDITALPPSFREGVDLFIQKPFPVSRLIEALHKLVSDETLDHAAP
jgi:two-component system, cell cycle sensor histidine kinase and response regulator CckA